MNTRPAWGILFIGALIVIGLLLSPAWLDRLRPYLQEEEAQAPFPPAFYELSAEEQDLYTSMYENTSEQMAIDFVAARLATPEALAEPNLPVLDSSPDLVELLLSGTFVTISPIRSATGSAGIYRLSDGRRLLRLEGLDTYGGPDLHVLLTAYPNPTTQEELDQVAQLQIDVGPLKATQGEQNYFIEDPTFNVENYQSGSVVLYSTRYEIVFSYAPLSPPE